MKKTTTFLSALSVLFYLIALMPSQTIAQGDSMKIGHTILPSFVTRGTKMSVTIFIDKGYVGGVAELDEVIPPGFMISEGDKNGSTFGVIGDTLIKFMWESMPSEPGFTVSYHLTVPADALGKYPMVAQFKYRTSTGDAVKNFPPNMFTVKLPFDSVTIAESPKAVKNKPVAPKPEMTRVVNTGTSYENVNGTSAPKTDTTASAKTVQTTSTPTPTAATPQAPKAAPIATPAPTVSAPTTATTNGLYYRVQIMASAQRLDVDSVIINGIRDKLYILTKNGISRYYVGAFHELQPAKDYRDRIMNCGLKGPFVVAYKNGQKITIKESLQVVATN